jgi:hypothetical protein
MSVLIVSEWEPGAGMSAESYWRLTDDMDLRDHLPEGCECHMSGFSDEGGAILSEVWTSREAHQSFLENELGPASAAAGVPGPTKVSVLPLIRHL